MKRPHLSQGVALNHAFQKSLPLCQAMHAIRMAKLSHSVVISRVLQSRYRRGLHHANISRLKRVFFMSITTSVIKQLLIPQPYVQALFSPFIGLDDEIQGGCYRDQQTTECSDGCLVNENANECSAPSHQVYELERVSQAMEQPFLEQEILNGVSSFGFRFVRNICPLMCGICIHENSSLPAALLIPIIRIVVVIRKVWWPLRHIYRRIKRALFWRAPFMYRLGIIRIHRKTPLLSVNKCNPESSLVLILANCSNLLMRGAP